MKKGTKLHISGLTKSFTRKLKNRKEEQFKLLDNIELQIPQGKVTALMGGNGSGKTTLFNIISGFEKADSGKILIRKNNKILNVFNYKDYERSRNLRIGRLFQHGHIFPNLTVMENMKMAKPCYIDEKAYTAFSQGRHSQEQQLEEIIREQFLLFFPKNHIFLNYFDKPAGKLSGGETRLLGLLRLFLTGCDLMLLDEPTASVDRSNIGELVRIISHLAENEQKSILLVEHNMEFVRLVASETAYILNKKIALHGNTNNILNHSLLRSHHFDVEGETLANGDGNNHKPILELRKLGFGYDRKNLLQKNINIKLYPGDKLLLLGSNGAGKSSMIKAILGDSKLKKEGTILFNGQDITHKPLAHIMQQSIAYFAQGGRVYPHLTVHENLKMAGLTMSNKLQIINLGRIYHDIPELQELKNRQASYLSGGQRHQLALGMALIKQPKLLILDEPVAGLSDINAKKIYNILGNLYKNHTFTLILVEHNKKIATTFCNRIKKLEILKNKNESINLNTIKLFN